MPLFGTVLPDAPKPWAVVRPSGVHLFEDVLCKETRDELWAFFHPKDGHCEGEADKIGTPGEGEFQWYQRFKRFPKTAHFNGWHSGKFSGEDGAAMFQAEHPALYKAATEAIDRIKGRNEDMSDVPAWGGFEPESVAVMRHKPGWGLGTHYDNAQDEGEGMVLMLSLSSDDAVPRVFQFTDPPGGRKFPVPTKDGQALVFGGEAYDFWMHESLHNHKQSGETISLTIRLADVCGHQAAGGGQYSTGAPAAKKVAHARLAKRKREEPSTSAVAELDE